MKKRRYPAGRRDRAGGSGNASGDACNRRDERGIRYRLP